MEADIIQATRTKAGYVILRGVGNAKVSHEQAKLEAAEIRVDSEIGSVLAIGGAKFISPQGSISANSFDYNYNTKSGKVVDISASKGLILLKGQSAVVEPTEPGSETTNLFGVFHLNGASVTTCDKAHPDYQLTARQVDLYPDGKFVARHVSLWMGGLKLLTLPKLSLNLSRDTTSRWRVLPAFGADGDDGFFVGLGFPVISATDYYIGLQGRATQNQGIQGALSTEYLLAGDSKGSLSPKSSDSVLDLHTLPLMRVDHSGASDALTAQKSVPSQLRMFMDVGRKQKVYDTDAERLYVSRLPEVGLRYSASTKIPDASTELMQIGRTSTTSAFVSYSKINESTGLYHIGRFDARALMSLRLSNLGHKTALQPVLFTRYSNYSTGDSYRILAGSVNLAHVFSKDSYISTRLTKYWLSGNTPLEYDDVDVQSDLQTALWYRAGRNVFGFEIDYGLSGEGLYDWGITYGRALHCLEPRITWRNKFESISFELSVLGF